MTIVYRAVKGSNLTADEVDGNFHDLDNRVTAITDGLQPISIDHFTITGDQLSVTLTDSTVKGPYTLPTAEWNPRGDWLPDTVYAKLDVVSFDGDLYLVDNPHTSAGSFDPNANGGPGVPFYSLILEQPMLHLPSGGERNMRLRKASCADFDTEWAYDTRNYGIFIQGAPADDELILRYQFAESTLLRHSLPTSVGSAVTGSSADAQFVMALNGVVIGSVWFFSGTDAVFDFPADIVTVHGDVLTINAPSPADTTLANISITIAAELLG